jgi:glutamate transport system substrate-binding protein
MRKRRFSLVALVLVLALAGAACGDDDEPTISGDTTTTAQRATAPTFDPGTTMARIQERGKLIVGTKFDQPLFGLKNPISGEIEGFDVEIGKLIAVGIFGGDLNSVKDKVEFVETVSRVREPRIQDGSVDVVVATYTINDTRKQQVDFAGPYLVADQDVMVRADDNRIRSVSDLNGKKVCSAFGSTSIRNVQTQAPRSDTSISFDRYSLCAEALGDGRVDAVSTDDAILAGLVNDNPGKFKLAGLDLSDEPYGIGLKKGDDAFRDFLNDRLEEIYGSDEWADAFRRTVGRVITEVPTPPRVDRYTAAPAGAGTTTTASTTTTTR